MGQMNQEMSETRNRSRVATGWNGLGTWTMRSTETGNVHEGDPYRLTCNGRGKQSDTEGCEEPANKDHKPNGMNKPRNQSQITQQIKRGKRY